MKTANSISEVIQAGLCIGCGLCEAVTNGRISMQMTPAGSLRPFPTNQFTPQEEAQLLAACPGTIAEPFDKQGSALDLVWGSYMRMQYAWAGDADVRFRSATGGVLTALGVHLLDAKQASFILHVRTDPAQPMRSRWVMSNTSADVIAHAGSRYGPVAPLAGLFKALERNEPFAIIAKPCDLGAVHQLSKTDERINRLCVARLVMVCGGQSRLRKSTAVLEAYGLSEEELTLFRYRGYGNPGRTRIETKDGRAFEKTYQQLWEDESKWEIETRCKFCPDALGEAADIAAADVWPGGGPMGEDAGFNGIVVRSARGEQLVETAVASGDLILGDTITPTQFNNFQPHQVRKKEALTARFDGLANEGQPVIQTQNLRLAQLGQRLTVEQREREVEGTRMRVRNGRFAEELT